MKQLHIGTIPRKLTAYLFFRIIEIIEQAKTGLSSALRRVTAQNITTVASPGTCSVHSILASTGDSTMQGIAQKNPGHVLKNIRKVILYVCYFLLKLVCAHSCLTNCLAGEFPKKLDLFFEFISHPYCTVAAIKETCQREANTCSSRGLRMKRGELLLPGFNSDRFGQNVMYECSQGRVKTALYKYC